MRDIFQLLIQIIGLVAGMLIFAAALSVSIIHGSMVGVVVTILAGIAMLTLIHLRQ